MRKLRGFFDCLHNIGEWVVNIDNCTTDRIRELSATSKGECLVNGQVFDAFAENHLLLHNVDIEEVLTPLQDISDFMDRASNTELLQVYDKDRGLWGTLDEYHIDMKGEETILIYYGVQGTRSRYTVSDRFLVVDTVRLKELLNEYIYIRERS